MIAARRVIGATLLFSLVHLTGTASADDADTQLKQIGTYVFMAVMCEAELAASSKVDTKGVLAKIEATYKGDKPKTSVLAGAFAKALMSTNLLGEPKGSAKVKEFCSNSEMITGWAQFGEQWNQQN